jgi:hypothetical protein
LGTVFFLILDVMVDVVDQRHEVGLEPIVLELFAQLKARIEDLPLDISIHIPVKPSYTYQSK